MNAIGEFMEACTNEVDREVIAMLAQWSKVRKLRKLLNVINEPGTRV